MSQGTSQETALPESSEGTVELPRAGEPAAPADEEGATAEFGDGLVETGGPGELTAEELLSIPPRADNLAEELAARPPRARLPKVTLALSAGILIAAGFVGGVLVQKHLGGGPGSGGARAGAPAAFGAGRGRGSFTGGSGSAGFGGTGSGTGTDSITGSITVVSGDTLYITAGNGSVYTVKTSGGTAVQISSTGSLSQLKPGQTVTVSGTQGSGGTVDATTITAGNR
jgi:hypothetical protein